MQKYVFLFLQIRIVVNTILEAHSMFLPILEIYIIRDFKDEKGSELADKIIGHFRGSPYTGLIQGAVEVFDLHQGWYGDDGPPRPIPSDRNPLPNNLEQARFTAIVPILGIELAQSVQGNDSWKNYVNEIVQLIEDDPQRFSIFPVLVNGNHSSQIHVSYLYNRLGRYQAIRFSSHDSLCLDLTQGIAQWLLKERERITVFISHAKHNDNASNRYTNDLIQSILYIIQKTHLDKFFDAIELQPGCDWEKKLCKNAATSAFLGLRTDSYFGRQWCQKEILIAKSQGMPVVILAALDQGDRRGSFLLDHVPIIPVRFNESGALNENHILRAINLLIDGCLKRALWSHQKDLFTSRSFVQPAWWAHQPPEPMTLVHWFAANQSCLPVGDIKVLHPEPSLLPSEQSVLQQMFFFMSGRVLDLMTPRQMASRGG